MEKEEIKTKKVYCQYPCCGHGHYSGVYGIITCENCNGKGYRYVKYHKPNKNWVKLKDQ